MVKKPMKKQEEDEYIEENEPADDSFDDPDEDDGDLDSDDF